jgi:hypothetical protein
LTINVPDSQTVEDEFEFAAGDQTAAQVVQPDGLAVVLQ